MKFIKRTLVVLVIVLAAAVVINDQTDFFLNIGKYVPSVEEKNPEFAQSISELSKAVSSWTDKLPGISEIKSWIFNEEMPVDPSDIAVTTHIENSPMLSFYPEENIGIQMKDDQTVTVFGIVKSASKAHLIVTISDGSGEELLRTSVSVDSSGEFARSVKVPETEEDRLELSVYTGAKQYGEYTSWVYRYVHLNRTDAGGWEIEKAPVYESNKEFYERDKSISEALRATNSIDSDSTAIISIAKQLTAGCETDYEKLLTLHDWVCSYIYYDQDSIDSGATAPYTASKVVELRRAVCLGYANLYAALCRSIGIPCNVVAGYALGVNADEVEWTEENMSTSEQNHAWNEAYADGRWVIIDTTWDSRNKYEGGEFIKGSTTDHLYFDANLDFFSSNHRIQEYIRRG